MHLPLRIPRFVVTAHTRLQPFLEWLPFTTGGALFCLSAGLGVWFFGVQRSDFILIVIGAVGLLISLLSMLCTWIFGALLWNRYRQLAYDSLLLRVGETHRVDSSIVVPWWMPLMQVSSHWMSTAVQAELGEKQEVLTPTRRGVWSNVQRKITVGDAFGICTIRFASVQPCTLKVLPESIPPTLPTVLQGLQGGGDHAHPYGLPTGDRIDIRNYAQGDPVRYILWKVYARTGQLVVRTPEKAFKPVQRLLAYLIVHPADGSAAALSTSILQANQLGENWAFGVDGYQGACTDVSSAIEVIVASGNSAIQDGQGLEEFVTQQRDASSLLVFAPAKPGDWVEEVMALASRLPIQVCMVGKAPYKRSPLETVLFTPRDTAVDQMDQVSVRQVIKKLESVGVSVSIVFPTGLVLDSREFIRQFPDRGAA